VFVSQGYSWIWKAGKVESQSLPWADWKGKENPAKFDNDCFGIRRSGDRNRI
jgi:hypothetical protein